MKRLTLLLALFLFLFSGCGLAQAVQSTDAASASPAPGQSSVSRERVESAPTRSAPESSIASSASRATETPPPASSSEPCEESSSEPQTESNVESSSASNEAAEQVQAEPEPIDFPEVKEVSGGLSYTFSTLPQTAQQLESILDLSDARHTAALFMAALARYVESEADGVAMIDVLRGPQPMSAEDQRFLRERLSDKKYLPLAYFEGANPQNNYTPEEPLVLIVYDDPVTAEQGYRYVQVATTGADSKRRIVLREKEGNFYIWDYPGIVSGIRLPASEDTWA